MEACDERLFPVNWGEEGKQDDSLVASAEATSCHMTHGSIRKHPRPCPECNRLGVVRIITRGGGGVFVELFLNISPTADRVTGALQYLSKIRME